MFLVKSVFWLSVAFLLIGPGFDFGDTPELLQQAAMAGAREMVVSSLQQQSCGAGGCFTEIASQQAEPEQPEPLTIPLPRPRPAFH